MLVFEERGKPEYLEKKPLRARERTNNKLNPHMVSTLGFVVLNQEPFHFGPDRNPLGL